MERPRHEIEAQVPTRRERPAGPGGNSAPGRPKIRRQLERICEALDLNYADLIELQVKNETVSAILYDRNEKGELYRDEFDKVATRGAIVPVDTTTFRGDERDF